MSARLTGRGALLAAACAAAAAPSASGAQAVRVDVRDAATGAPVPQALVTLRPDGGATAAQGLTPASGRRVLPAVEGAYRVEVRRMGHRPYVGPAVRVRGRDTTDAVVRLASAPVTLVAERVTGRAVCGTPADPAVLALWDAARTALATAAETRAEGGLPAVTFDRTLDTAGAVLRQVRTNIPPDSARGRVFWAATPGAFERLGFVFGSLDHGAQFHGPDERTLLSDAFARTHCFAPARGEGAAAGWLGVRFDPAPGRRMPEVAGVVWLDSASAEPRRVDFRYVWDALPRDARAVGGASEFGRLRTGEVGVVTSHLRVPRVERRFGRLRVVGYREWRWTLDTAAAPRLRVAGVVYDSLVGGPLGGALVTRPGAPGVAVTDGLGRFALDGVEAAPGEFVFSHAALDSAGLPDLVARVDLSDARDSASVTLATPSRATVWARACGAPEASPPGAGARRPGLLVGTVRDARTGEALPGATATLAWTAVDTVNRRLTAAPRTRALAADSAGTFRACGVPVGTELEVQGAAGAAAGVAASGWALVTVGARGLAAVDLLVARRAPGDSAAPRAVATGVVRDSMGTPRAGARITVEGLTGAEAVTGPDGAFRLPGVPAGTQTLVVRSLGYAPQAVSVGLRADAAAPPVDVVLRRVVRLAGVTSTARRTALAAVLDGVRRRALLGTAVVLDSATIDRAFTVRAALSRLPYVTFTQAAFGGGWAATVNSGRGCPLVPVVDDRLSTWQEVHDIPPDQIAAVEMYRRAAQVPARFQTHFPVAQAQGRGGCGMLLLWTKGAR